MTARIVVELEGRVVMTSVDDRGLGEIVATAVISGLTPLELVLTFREHGARDAVEWVFARELMSDALSTGYSSPNAEGDVFMWLSGDKLNVTLSSPDGTAMVEFPSAPWFEFRSSADADIPAVVPERAVDQFLYTLGLGGPPA